jgi:hypothetical protein
VWRWLCMALSLQRKQLLELSIMTRCRLVDLPVARQDTRCCFSAGWYATKYPQWGGLLDWPRDTWQLSYRLLGSLKTIFLVQSSVHGVLALCEVLNCVVLLAHSASIIALYCSVVIFKLFSNYKLSVINIAMQTDSNTREKCDNWFW